MTRLFAPHAAAVPEELQHHARRTGTKPHLMVVTPLYGPALYPDVEPGTVLHWKTVSSVSSSRFRRFSRPVVEYHASTVPYLDVHDAPIHDGWLGIFRHPAEPGVDISENTHGLAVATSDTGWHGNSLVVRAAPLLPSAALWAWFVRGTL